MDNKCIEISAIFKIEENEINIRCLTISKNRKLFDKWIKIKKPEDYQIGVIERNIVLFNKVNKSFYRLVKNLKSSQLDRASNKANREFHLAKNIKE